MKNRLERVNKYMDVPPNFWKGAHYYDNLAQIIGWEGLLGVRRPIRKGSIPK